MVIRSAPSATQARAVPRPRPCGVPRRACSWDEFSGAAGCSAPVPVKAAPPAAVPWRLIARRPPAVRHGLVPSGVPPAGYCSQEHAVGHATRTQGPAPRSPPQQRMLVRHTPVLDTPEQLPRVGFVAEKFPRRATPQPLDLPRATHDRRPPRTPGPPTAGDIPRTPRGPSSTVPARGLKALKTCRPHAGHRHQRARGRFAELRACAIPVRFAAASHTGSPSSAAAPACRVLRQATHARSRLRRVPER